MSICPAFPLFLFWPISASNDVSCPSTGARTMRSPTFFPHQRKGICIARKILRLADLLFLELPSCFKYLLKASYVHLVVYISGLIQFLPADHFSSNNFLLSLYTRSASLNALSTSAIWVCLFMEFCSRVVLGVCI